ncbi:MAG: DUF1987 domain-containing protein [Chlorobi bacterium]|nr:DUF1987 domain-containing protein [Chlorobiota bacterium]
METLFLEGTTDTPYVNLDADSGTFIISGSSMPEDVKEFYEPIMNWFDEYFQSPNKSSLFQFGMVYFNTASSKMLLDILYKLKDAMDEGHDVKIIWKYYEDDEEMMEAGEDFSEIIEMPIEIECIQNSSSNT